MKSWIFLSQLVFPKHPTFLSHDRNIQLFCKHFFERTRQLRDSGRHQSQKLNLGAKPEPRPKLSIMAVVMSLPPDERLRHIQPLNSSGLLRPSPAALRSGKRSGMRK